MPLEVALDPVNIRASAQKAIDSRSPEVTSRLQLEMGSDDWVMADDERLATVFSNLISNAIKYSPSHSMCRIMSRVVSRDTLAAGGHSKAQLDGAPPQWVVVGVADQGEGIAPEDQAKLFQKFGRLPRSMTTSVRGTGLGLWICKQYIEAMGGDIWVESEFGKGSCFQFSLPLTQPPERG
jgi:signal transduction histidine kinase